MHKYNYTATPTQSPTGPVVCRIKIPDNPLTAAGLAKPYELLDCAMATTPSFVQATIFDTDLGTFSIYNPLVITFGTLPGVAPPVPILPKNAVIGIWFGSNADVLLLVNQIGIINGNCINGLGNNGGGPGFKYKNGTLSPFGQYAHCNAQNFFTAVNNNFVKPIIPPLGTASDGLPCPTTRDFFLVDADPNDNVQTTYLLLPGGVTAQDTPSNRAKYAGSWTLLSNPSDEALLTEILNPVIGCDSFRAPDLVFPNDMLASLALNELQASLFQQPPIALVPIGNPMVLVNGLPNLEKLNLFREGINEPLLIDMNQASNSVYCRNMLYTGLTRIMNNRGILLAAPTPVPIVANNLYNFLLTRFSTSYGILLCANQIGIPNPITLTTTNGVTTSATIAAF